MQEKKIYKIKSKKMENVNLDMTKFTKVNFIKKGDYSTWR